MVISRSLSSQYNRYCFVLLTLNSLKIRSFICVAIFAKQKSGSFYSHLVSQKSSAFASFSGTQGTEKTEVLRTRFLASYTSLSSLSSAEGRYHVLMYRFPLLRPLVKKTSFSSSVYRHLFISCLSAFAEIFFPEKELNCSASSVFQPSKDCSCFISSINSTISSGSSVSTQKLRFGNLASINVSPSITASFLRFVQSFFLLILFFFFCTKRCEIISVSNLCCLHYLDFL